MGTPATVQQALTGLTLGEKTIIDIVGPVGENEGGVSFRIVKEPKPLAISPPKQHTFQAVAGFVAYLTKYGGTDTVVLCDAQTGRCCAVLNERAPTGFEVVTFTPQPHPTFAAWAPLFGRRLPILELAQFIQKQRRAISNGDDLSRAMRQIRAAVGVEINEGVGNGKVNGILTKVKIQSAVDTKPVDLPETITITTPLFIDSEKPATLELDLTLDADADNKKVFATLTSPTLEVVRFEELKEYASKFAAFTFAFGAPQHGAWKFID